MNAEKCSCTQRIEYNAGQSFRIASEFGYFATHADCEFFMPIELTSLNSINVDEVMKWFRQEGFRSSAAFADSMTPQTIPLAVGLAMAMTLVLSAEMIRRRHYFKELREAFLSGWKEHELDMSAAMLQRRYPAPMAVLLEQVWRIAKPVHRHNVHQSETFGRRPTNVP